MKSLSFLLFLLVILAVSCRKEIAPLPQVISAASVDKQTVDMNKQLKIAVLSDIHYASRSLFQNNGQTGEAFMNYLYMDPKMLYYSEPIFQSVLADLSNVHPDILLITGDLTKDGEVASHTEVANALSQLQAAGTKVFVIPGNHDINNPEAVSYDGNSATSLPKFTTEQFKTMYHDFGYNATDQTILRDGASLSYLAKPYSNLWILAIDASKYEQNTVIAKWDGEIKPSTMTWIKQMLQVARDSNAVVLTMMHHNLLEHFVGETELQPGYTVDNWQTVAAELANAGVTAIFTGHYHANDITTANFNGREVIDIETGSLVNIPFAYRVITMKNRTLDMTTHHVTSVLEPLPGGKSFPEFSQDYLYPLLDTFITGFLAQMNVSDPQVTVLLRTSFLAHSIGDEQMPVDMRKTIAAINKMPGGETLAFMLNTLWTDINTKDNSGPITLQSRW